MDVIKAFETKEGTIKGGQYEIAVEYNGRVVKKFRSSTMEGARRALRNAGYVMVAWTEGSKIILQNER